VVDGNVERVVARVFDVQTPLPSAKPELYRLADSITPDEQSGDFAQAMMDLGSTICTPRAPKCLLCPLNADCRATDPASLPRKLPKAARPERHGIVWWIERDGHVLLVRRPPEGLLGGMRALPGTPWSDGAAAPGPSVTHGFTHFRLTLTVLRRDHGEGCNLPAEAEWWPVARIGEAGLPTVFMKAATRAIGEESDVRHAA
ncbi:MAG: NUDIX domain-containing protein, partial [Sphingomonadaceae bacterium]